MERVGGPSMDHVTATGESHMYIGVASIDELWIRESDDDCRRTTDKSKVTRNVSM
jgi:hypothetical protein